MGAGSNPAGPTFHPAPCLWPGTTSRTTQSFGILHLHSRPRRGSGIQASGWLSSATVVTLGVN